MDRAGFVSRLYVPTDFDTSKKALVERFEPSLWCALLDFVTVYSKEDVRFTFNDGTEIRA